MVFLILVSLVFVSCASNRQPASVVTDPMDVKQGNNTDYYDATIYGGR